MHVSPLGGESSGDCLVLPFSLRVFLCCPFAGRLISLIDVGHNPRLNYKSRSPLSNGQRDRYRCLAFSTFRDPLKQQSSFPHKESVLAVSFDLLIPEQPASRMIRLLIFCAYYRHDAGVEPLLFIFTTLEHRG